MENRKILTQEEFYKEVGKYFKKRHHFHLGFILGKYREARPCLQYTKLGGYVWTRI